MHVRSLLAGAGLAAVVAAVPLAVVSVASADDGSSSASSGTGCAAGQRWELAGDAGALLSAHPDVQQLLTALGQAPAGQRAEAAQAYLSAHPEVGADLRAARSQLQADRAQLRADRQTCRSGG
jgi:hemophore-related protein